MRKVIEKFMKDEKGYTAESLAWTLILGLGATTICFGLYAANRFLTGNMVGDIRALSLEPTLPSLGDPINPDIQAGHTYTAVELDWSGE